MARGVQPRRFAESLMAIAREKGNYEEWQTDLHLLASFLEDEALQRFLESPAIGIDEKRRALQQMLAARVQPYALNLALVLAHARGLRAIGQIAERFDRLVDVVRNRAVADVTTAVPLDAAEEGKIRDSLQRFTGKTIIVRPHVDPAILGGFVARIGDTLLDASVAHRLATLRQRILNLAEA